MKSLSRLALHRCALAAMATGLASTALLAASPAWAQWKWKDANGRITASDRPPPREVPERDILTRPVAAAKPGRFLPMTAAAVGAPAAASAAAGGASAPASRPPAPAAPAASANALQAQVDAKRKQAEAEAAAKTKAEQDRVATAKADNCRRARSQITTLESGMRITRVAPNGEREIMDDRTRNEELRQARQIAQSDCG